MAFLVGVLIIIILILIGFIVSSQSQIRNISRQLNKRLTENSRQPISLELINSDLNCLAVKLNKCFQAEETLRLKNVQEEKRFKEMIANISHDLRTPLTAIKGYQQLLEKEKLTVEQQNKLQVAMRHADELGQLIEHFFEYSYLANVEPERKPERFNLTNLLTECLVASITALEEKGIKVEFHETSPIYICNDKEMATRILQNLIRNAIQHSNGDIKVQLFKHDNIEISFQNQVKNPAEIDINRIFERFYSGDKSRSRSSGLGLSIVRLLAELMGGRVDAVLNGSNLEIKVELKSLP